MPFEILCLNQLIQLYIPDLVADDIVVFHLFNARNVMSPFVLREKLMCFISMGFDPHNPFLSFTSRAMMKSVVAKCDSII